MDRLRPNQVEMLSSIAEMKRIFASISRSVAGMDSICIVMTSASRGEGKTTLTALLAATAAQQTDREVLALDLNWHQPALHNCFALQPTLDLDQFRVETGIESQVQATSIEGLKLLSAPPPTTSERWLRSDVLDLGLTVMESARSSYGIVLVDTASVYPTNRNMIDPVVLAGAASASLLVVLASVTPKERVKRTLMNLETAGANVLGTVVNQWQNALASE